MVSGFDLKYKIQIQDIDNDCVTYGLFMTYDKTSSH